MSNNVELPIYVHIDHNGQEARNYSEEKLSSAPISNLYEGRKYFNTTDKKLYVYNGSAWKECGDSSSLKSVVAGSTKISVDNTDPTNPEIDVVVSNLIDDTQSTSSNIYSAQKVDSEISNAVNGLADLAYKNTIDSSSLIDDGVVSELKLSTAVQTKLNANASQNNSTATTDPTVDDDSSLGYSIKSLWLNQTTKEAFMCFDATEGSAVWVKQTLTVDELGALALKNTIDSSSLIENGVVTSEKLDVQFAANFLSTDFVSGVLSIPASTHGLGATEDLEVTVKNSAKSIVNGGVLIATASNGTVTVSVNEGLEFNGRILIKRLG